MFFRNPIARSICFLFMGYAFSPTFVFSQGLMSKLNTFDLILKYRNSSLKPVYGVTVRMESEGMEDKVFVSTKDSNQGVQFFFDKKYLLTIYKDNYTPLKIIVDTDFKEKKEK